MILDKEQQILCTRVKNPLNNGEKSLPLRSKGHTQCWDAIWLPLRLSRTRALCPPPFTYCWVWWTVIAGATLPFIPGLICHKRKPVSSQDSNTCRFTTVNQEEHQESWSALQQITLSSCLAKGAAPACSGHSQILFLLPLAGKTEQKRDWQQSWQAYDSPVLDGEEPSTQLFSFYVPEGLYVDQVSYSTKYFHKNLMEDP